MEIYKTYIHAPAHLFRSNAIYFITAATLYHKKHFTQDKRKIQLRDSMDYLCNKYDWDLICWVILSNHYHILLKAPIEAKTLSRWIADLHKYTSRQWNDEDGKLGRQMWYEYWDTCITYDRSFFARLNYIHWNPVKHGYVDLPEDYNFSSYREYISVDENHTHYIEREYPWDRVKGIKDDF